MTPKFKSGDSVYYIGYCRHADDENSILPAVVRDFNDEKIMLWCTDFFNKGLKIMSYNNVFQTSQEAEHELFIRATTKKSADWTPLIVLVAVLVIVLIVGQVCK